MAQKAFTRRAVVAASAGLVAPARANPTISWRALGAGLEHAHAQISATIGDRQLHAVRVDPTINRFVLLSGVTTHTAPRTARQWARERGFVAAINAGMFRADRLPVGFAKADGNVIQPSLTRDRSVFVFDAADARLLDLSCDAFISDEHDNAMQSIRMISCDGRNVWSRQSSLWSVAALAQDVSGKILLLHTRSPLSVHDFIEAVKALPLGIVRAMYLEGGPEATLYARGAGGREEIERFGSYETGFNENDANTAAWPLPNVLGVVSR